MKKFSNVWMFLFVFLSGALFTYAQEMPLGLRPRLDIFERCLDENTEQKTCFKYFADEIELVVGNSIFKPLPRRADELDGIRALIGGGKAESYDFYSDELIRKLNLRPDIEELVKINFSHIVRVRFKNVNKDEEFFNAISLLSQDYNIKEVRVVSEVKALGHTNDPGVSQQYYLSKEKFDEAQKLAGFCNKNINIFPNDTGWGAHSDLPTPVGGFDYIANARRIPSDGFGHGTTVAGVMAMIPNNSDGGVGTCPNASFWPMKVLGDDGAGTWNVFVTAIVDQANTCANLKEQNPNARCVANYSIGGLGPVPSVDAALAVSHKVGFVSVAGSGNVPVALESFPFYPAAAKDVVAVSSLDEKDNKSVWSAYSPNLLTTSAYGEGIFTTALRSGIVSSPTGYVKASGSSYAAPQVTGAVGLLWSLFPDLTPQQVRFIVLGTADQIPHLRGIIASGGRLNALTMLTVDFEESPSASKDFEIKNTSHISITTTQSFNEPVVAFVVCFSEEPFGEENLSSPEVKCSFRFDPTLLNNVGQTSEMLLSYRREDTDYFLRTYAINRVGNISPLSEMLQTRTKKSEVNIVRNFSDENGQPDSHGWYPWRGASSRNVNDIFIPHLSNILPSSNGESRWLWRIGRRNQLDYFTNNVADVLVVSEIFDFRGTNGASLYFDYFQVTSPLFRYVDKMEVWAVEIDENNAWIKENMVKDYSSYPNSSAFATSEDLVDLSVVSGKKFRLVFRFYYGTAGMFGGIGWMFGDLKLFTDQREYFY